MISDHSAPFLLNFLEICTILQSFSSRFLKSTNICLLNSKFLICFHKILQKFYRVMFTKFPQKRWFLLYKIFLEYSFNHLFHNASPIFLDSWPTQLKVAMKFRNFAKIVKYEHLVWRSWKPSCRSFCGTVCFSILRFSLETNHLRIPWLLLSSVARCRIMSSKCAQHLNVRNP